MLLAERKGVLKVFYSKRVVSVLNVYYYMQVFSAVLRNRVFTEPGVSKKDAVIVMDQTSVFRFFFSSILNSPMAEVSQEQL